MIKIICELNFLNLTRLTLDKDILNFIELDYGQIKSLEFYTTDRGDINLPVYGIISNGGNIYFKDIINPLNRQYLIEFYNKKNYLKNKAIIDIYIINTINGKKQILGSYQTEKWNYINETKEVELSFTDDLQEWQNIIIEPLECNPTKKEPVSFRYIYDYLLQKTPDKYKMLKFEELDNDTQDVISKSSTLFPFLYQGTLWECWRKFCEVLLLHIYKSEKGKTICKYNGGD
jgi:hypothetical protein